MIKFKVFLSHQGTDKPFVESLAINLRKNGVEVFFDKWDIRPGDNIPEELESGLQNSNIFLYILSPSSVESKWVRGEYYAYLYRKMNDHSIRIIPLLRKECEKPAFIAPLKYINFIGFDFTNEKNFNVELNNPFSELIHAIFKTSYKEDLGEIHPSLASYEFYFQPKKGEPFANEHYLYEIGFKNLTDQSLLNFRFNLVFNESVQEVIYEFFRSSANMTGGKGLYNNNTEFNWFGNQIAEDGGWIVFVVKTKKNNLCLKRISTKLVGRIVQTNEIIKPDNYNLY